MSRNTKNPSHPSALSVNDLTIGRRVIIFNINVGVVSEGVIVSRPYAKFDPMLPSAFPGKQLMVDIRSNTDGKVHSHYLTALGVIPANLGDARPRPWSWVNYVVDYRKRSLLPDPIGLPHDFLDQLWLDMELEEILSDGQEEGEDGE